MPDLVRVPTVDELAVGLTRADGVVVNPVTATLRLNRARQLRAKIDEVLDDLNALAETPREWR